MLTFYRSSKITFVKADESKVDKGFGFIGLTFFLGWWGIPWGPIRSVRALATNFKGGKDVTDQIAAAMRKSAAATPAWIWFLNISGVLR